MRPSRVAAACWPADSHAARVLEKTMDDTAIPLEGHWCVVKRLTEDTKRCMSALDATPRDDEEGRSFWRRMYARTVFATIDATIYLLTFRAYSARNRKDVVFSLDERKRLEESYDFDEDRAAVTAYSKDQRLDNLKFAFNVFARVHYSDYVLPIGDPGWLLVKEIEGLREDLQYARTEGEVEVYEEDVDDLMGGMLWFLERQVELIQSTCAQMVEKLADREPDADEIVM